MKQKESKKRGIVYYIKVWLKIVKLSLSKTHTYKMEVWANILRTVVTIIPQIIALYALYGGGTEYAGWKIEESFLILGIFNLLNYIAWSFYFINLGRLDDKIINGEWDFLMLKPISTIFSAGFIDFFVYNLVLALSGVGLIIYYLVKSDIVFSLEIFGKGAIVLSSAMIIWFALSLICTSFSFLKQYNGLLDFLKQVINIARFPISVWPNIIQIVFYTVIPIAFISTVPAKVITGALSWEAVGISVLISVFFLLLAGKIWNINISKYSSTGS